MSSPNDTGAAFVADVAHAFGQAFDRTEGASDVWLGLAGCTVRLRVAGSKLAHRLLPALAHLRTTPGDHVDFSVNCWDRAETGVAPPPPPGSYDDFLAHNRMRGFVHHGYRVTFDSWMRMLCAYDRDEREAFVHVADAELLPAWVDRAPLREVLTWWASDRDFVFLHASAVATDAGAVAISGASGSGKSTTALACLTEGMRLLGDDACIVRLEPTAMSYAVFGFAKVEPDALLRLPALEAFPQQTRDEQTVIEPGEAFIPEAPLRAVLLARVGSARRSRLSDVSRSDALRTLVASSLLEGGGASGNALSAMRRLVEQVPCHRLELGFDMPGVVSVVRDFLDRQ